MTRQDPPTEKSTAKHDEFTADLASLNELYHLSTQLLPLTDFQTALEQILEAAMEILHAPLGNLQIYDPETQTLAIAAQRGFGQEFLDCFKTVSMEDNSACGRALEARQRLIIEDIKRDPAYALHRAVAASAGYRAVQSTPMLTRAGEILGILSTHFPQPHRPSERELRMLDLYLVHAVDAIERIRAEEALRHSREIREAIGNSIPYGIWTCDAQGRCTYVSDSFLKLTGSTQAECSEFGWSRLLHPDDAAATLTAWHECVRTGTTWERDHRVKGADDEWHPILARGVPVKDQSGNITGWVGINLDIANRVRMRELARRQAQMLEETHDAIFQWELGGGIVSWNRGAERLYGYGRQEALGKVAPELLQTRCEGSIEAVKSTLLEHGGWNGELRHRTKDGREIFVESRMMLWHAPHKPPLVIEANHDITDRKQAELALRASEQKLRDQARELEQQLIVSGRLVSLGQVSASMAHEFNNPLGIIIGFMEDLLGAPKGSDADRQALNIVYEEALRCKKIIEDLMDFGRPRSMEMSMVDMRGVIERSLKLVETRLYKQKIEAVSASLPELPKIYAASQQLTQVLVNLYFNAIDAMPNGGTLRVGATVADEHPHPVLVVSVTDTGIGMEEWELAKIFQPFYTARKRRGLGLGLPICERIVKNHGGEIKVRSRRGQGTTFEIYLPVMPPDAALDRSDRKDSAREGAH